MKRALKETTLFITAEQDGFTIISNNITRNTFLSDGAKALYIYLKSHNENFNLSAESIANYLHKSERTIRNEIKELQENGFLVLERKENSNTYFYKIYSSLKLEHLSEFTNEKILNAFWNNYIDLNDIKQLRKSNKINQKQLEEIINEIMRILKTSWIKDIDN